MEASRSLKPAVGYLALQHERDILPIWLGGTYEALPKGATLVKTRHVQARIGPPLVRSELQRLTTGQSASEASKRVAHLAYDAVHALSQNKPFDLSTVAPPSNDTKAKAKTKQKVASNGSLAPIFEELEHRFVAGSVTSPVSYYFSLGDKERWTVKISKNSCQIESGKASSPANCVLKTSPAMFKRIVQEAYTPTPAEFMSGRVKSNNVSLLLTFQKAFQLEKGASV